MSKPPRIKPVAGFIHKDSIEEPPAAAEDATDGPDQREVVVVRDEALSEGLVEARDGLIDQDGTEPCGQKHVELLGVQCFPGCKKHFPSHLLVLKDLFTGPLSLHHVPVHYWWLGDHEAGDHLEGQVEAGKGEEEDRHPVQQCLVLEELTVWRHIIGVQHRRLDLVEDEGAAPKAPDDHSGGEAPVAGEPLHADCHGGDEGDGLAER